MSSNIYEDSHLNVRYSKGVRGDGGEKEERVVDIYESVGTVNIRHDSQDGGADTQKRLSIVQRNSSRAAALILVLLLVAVIVLSKLYISASSEKHRLSNRFEKLQTAHEELKSSLLDSLCGRQRNAEGWAVFGCSCYYKSTEVKNWSDSRKACQDSGADLVTINNKNEQTFLMELDKNGDFWVGLQSVKKPWEKIFEWKWVDASRPGYMGWREKVALNPLESSTAYMNAQGTLQHTNNGSKQWICEKQIHL